MHVLLVRHGEWKWRRGRDEGDYPLSPKGRALASTVRRVLIREDLKPDAYLTTCWRHAQDTAKVLRGRDTRAAMVDVVGLTPKTAESQFTWRGILKEARSQGVTITDATTLAFVGHEPRLRQLCERVTGVDLIEIARLEVIVLEAKSVQSLLRRRAKVERRLAASAGGRGRPRLKTRARV